MPRVFVSHSNQDDARARAFKDALVRQGFDVWMARDKVSAGENIVEHLEEGLRGANVVLLLIGRDPSNWARNEWSVALRMLWDRRREVSLIPVLLPEAEPPTFLRGQPQVPVQDDELVWDNVAEIVRTWDADAFDWRASDDAKATVTTRLHALQRVAATLPDIA